MTEQDDQDCINFQNMLNSYFGIRDSKSPPKAQVDEASLQQAMDKNKESLKVKLMMRRPINQLVDQGIIPSPKKPLAYLEQCQKLERAKTENILKNLMKSRPDRQALIDHHILEDTTIDPSLQDKQRQLKKARLADDLNDRLSHRPGPLELVKGNILQIDESFAQAVKEGQIPFKRTCEGQALRHPAPSFTFEDDSGSDVALSPPQDLLDQSLSSMPSVESMVLSPYPNHDSPSNSMGELRINSATPPNSQPSPVSNHMLSSISSPSDHQPLKEIVSTTRRKKSKPKPQPKTRTIKFHEYKGPPSAQKSQASPSKDETSYELLLQQQTLLLQWQLKMQQKYPQVMLPAPQPTGDQLKTVNSVQGSSVELPPNNSPPPSQNFKNFEDMKVNALKAELKKRNLTVSGSKTQLLERLRNHLESSSNQNNIQQQQPTMEAATTTGVPINMNSHIIIDTRPTLVTDQAVVTSQSMEAPALMVYNTVPVQMQQSRPGSAAPMDVEGSEAMDCSADNEEIVKRQHQKILQLERELKRSQQQLQQHQWLQQQAQQQAQQQVLLASHPVPIAPQITQAVVQLKPTQQLLQQASKLPHSSSEQQSAFVKANLAAFIHSQQLNNVRLKNGIATLNQQNVPQYANVKPIVLCSAQTVPAVIEKPRANSLPNGVAQRKMIWPSSVPNLILPQFSVGTDAKLFLQKAPPDYSDAVKPQGKVKEKSKKSGRKSVKSQEVDDVLDVLISHGELPPSAAQDPVTPSTPESAKVGLAPTFPNVSEIQPTLPAPAPTCSPISEQSPAPLSLSSNPDPTLQDSGSSSDQGLVFDLQLEFQDLEAMDLGVLDHNETPPIKTMVPPSQNNSAPNYGDLDMDMDISEWLDILANNNAVPNANNTAPHYSSYNGGDPLLPSMENNSEPLDMFGMDNLEFKMPSDSNLLSWDKVDYAT